MTTQSNQSIVMRAFNQHLKDFIDDIQALFPENLKLRTFKNSITSFVKMNPRKPIEIWYSKVTLKYSYQILNEDIDFFEHKDYNEDIKNAEGSGLTIDIDFIEELREPLKKIESKDKQMAIKYVKEMTQLSTLYFS